MSIVEIQLFCTSLVGWSGGGWWGVGGEGRIDKYKTIHSQISGVQSRPHHGGDSAGSGAAGLSHLSYISQPEVSSLAGLPQLQSESQQRTGLHSPTKTVSKYI